MVDVVIIGAGVVGCLIARELSRYQLRIVLTDKAHDVSDGCSKANSGIVHAGYDAKPGTLKARLNVQGNRMLEGICSELSVSFKRIGSLVTSYNRDEMNTLMGLYERGLQNGVEGLAVLSSRESVKKLEPNLSDQVTGALYAPTAGVICPYGLTIAACENAVQNGVELMLDTQVQGIFKYQDAFHLNTSRGMLTSRFVINAAGIHADSISAMVEEPWFSIKPRRGEYMLLDKRNGSLVSSVLFRTPTILGKGILVTPTVDGHLLLGPTASDMEERELTDTTWEGLQAVSSGALSVVPNIRLRDVITSFAGIRPVPSTGDFIIQASEQVSGFVHAAGIESPGLTASPAIALRVMEILADLGLELKEKPSYNPTRMPPANFHRKTDEEKAACIKENPLHGHIVCRCETVTEAEIIEAIHRPCGARDLDGVKRRVRAGMGRCQGGFCAPRVAEILARELGIPLDQVTKKGGTSVIVKGKTK